jgi:hypothetical protein
MLKKGKEELDNYLLEVDNYKFVNESLDELSFVTSQI